MVNKAAKAALILDPVEPLKKVLDRKVKLTPGGKKALAILNGERNDSYYYQFEYGLINRRGKRVPNQNHSCHAQMSEFGKGAQAIYSKYPRAGNGANASEAELLQVSLKWNDWLVKRSPWASVFVPVTAEFATKRGVVVQDTSKPANLIVNGLIATRMPCENWGEVKRWYSLVELGCPEDMAFVLAVLFDDNGNARPMGPGHHPLEPQEMTCKAVEAFVKHMPQGCTHSYRENPNYYPCNAVWGGEEDYDERQLYSSFIKAQYKARPQDGQPVRRMFQVIEPDHRGNAKRVDGASYTMQQLAEIGNTEAQRIGAHRKPQKRMRNVKRKPRKAGPAPVEGVGQREGQ